VLSRNLSKHNFVKYSDWNIGMSFRKSVDFVLWLVGFWHSATVRLENSGDWGFKGVFINSDSSLIWIVLSEYIFVELVEIYRWLAAFRHFLAARFANSLDWNFKEIFVSWQRCGAVLSRSDFLTNEIVKSDREQEFSKQWFAGWTGFLSAELEQ
jgi:hypothetical protein